MRNPHPKFVILIFALSIAFLISDVPKLYAQQFSKKNIETLEVTFDKKEVYLWCDLGHGIRASENSECPEDGAKVNVSVLFAGRENVSEKYIYNVSGGRIIGQGSNVVWDLTKQKAGEYRITVNTEHRAMHKGIAVSKTIILVDCPECDPAVDCPSIDVRSDREFVSSDGKVSFDALISGGEPTRYTYSWRIVGGTIKKGKNTNHILVQLGPHPNGENIVATVEIGGMNPGYNCPSVASASVPIAIRPSDGNDPKPMTDSLELSRTAISVPCPEGCASRSGTPDDDRTINIQVKVPGSNPGHVRYAYSVTAGKIVGSGPQVVGDLSGVGKGSYEILASVLDPAVRFSKPMRSNVVVEDCPDCLCDVDCPSISVMGPASETDPGKPMTFTANLSGGSQDTVTYRWRVSDGSIISGQDTQSILVATTLKMAGKSVTATLEISRTTFQSRGGCPYVASATGIVRQRIPRLHK